MNSDNPSNESSVLAGDSQTAEQRAQIVANAGSLALAIEHGLLRGKQYLTCAEALVLGLLRQGVSKYLVIFGHGSTALAEILRVYESHGVVKVYQFRNEVSMSHAGTALSWIYGETSAVVTSIGPGALQAMSGSLTAASNGIGVYHLYGDETTHGEGYNMQQLPKPEQHGFGRLTQVMNASYVLHTPNALRDALRLGTATVHHGYKAGPFYLMLPINVQPEFLSLSLESLPEKATYHAQRATAKSLYQDVLDAVLSSTKLVIKVGAGGNAFSSIITTLAEKVSSAVVLSPRSTGLLPEAHPLNMHVGGSKGSISGNYAMENADTLIVIGSRAVCQSDCSGIGYPNVQQVININADVHDVQHYNNTLALIGDIGEVLIELVTVLESRVTKNNDLREQWLSDCFQQKQNWFEHRNSLYKAIIPIDPVWNKSVLSQPQAIKIVADFAKYNSAIKLFDAGDVQANGFQIVEDDVPYQSFTDSGASYMGFAVSALMAGAMVDNPFYAIAFTGDGSFVMNPQILIDGVEHGLVGMIALFDNQRMAAISNLQKAQYQNTYRTESNVTIDFVSMANSISGVKAIHAGHDAESLNSALAQAYAHPGLSLVHIPVYSGDSSDEGMGAYGSWNVGNWCEAVQNSYHKQKI